MGYVLNVDSHKLIDETYVVRISMLITVNAKILANRELAV